MVNCSGRKLRALSMPLNTLKKKSATCFRHFAPEEKLSIYLTVIPSASHRPRGFQPMARTDFEPAAPSKFSLSNALYLAKACQDAYYDDLFLADEVADLGLSQTIQPFHNDKHDSHGFVASTEQYVVLVFRGTNPLSIKNWLTDGAIHQVQLDDIPGKLHQG